MSKFLPYLVIAGLLAFIFLSSRKQSTEKAALKSHADSLKSELAKEKIRGDSVTLRLDTLKILLTKLEADTVKIHEKTAKRLKTVAALPDSVTVDLFNQRTGQR